MSADSQFKRIYKWVPRKELAYLQSVIDAHEGLTRIRTEKHEGDRSLVLFMVSPSQEDKFNDFMRYIEKEVSGPILSV